MAPQLFLIEGPVSTLKVGVSALNLLAPKQTSANAAAGIASALNDQYGTAANAAMVANYEGEEVDSFACYIGEHLVQGTFSRVFFKDGDYIKAVVAKQDSGTEPLYAYAMLRPSDGLLWMPYNTGRGVWAELRHNMKWMIWGAISIYLFFGAFILIEDVDLAKDQFFIFMLVVGLPLFMLLMGLWGFKDSLPEGRLSTAVFRTLGFPNSKSLNLKGASIVGRDGYIHEHSVFRYREIIKDDPHPASSPN